MKNSKPYSLEWFFKAVAPFEKFKWGSEINGSNEVKDRRGLVVVVRKSIGDVCLRRYRCEG